MSTYHHGKLREALLVRAAEVIEAGGVEAVSLRGLARDLGVSATAPARHFSSRIDLLRALAKEGYRQATQAVLAQSDAPALSRPKAMARAYVAWCRENPPLFASIMHPDVSRHMDEELQAALTGFAGALRAAIVNAQAAGWKPEDDAEVLLHHAVAVIRGLTLNLQDPAMANTFGELTDAQISSIIDASFAP